MKAGSVGRKSSSTLIIGHVALLLKESEAAGKRGLWKGRWVCDEESPSLAVYYSSSYELRGI